MTTPAHSPQEMIDYLQQQACVTIDEDMAMSIIKFIEEHSDAKND